MAITLSHGGPTIYRSAEPSRQVLVGTIAGVVRIERDPSGPGWHVADRTLSDKHVHALLIEPESGTILAGMKHGSIFASADGGRTWERRDKGLTEHNVYSLACTRLANGVRVFAGTEPAHLFCSDDLGRGWAELRRATVGRHVAMELPGSAERRAHQAHQLPPARRRDLVHRYRAGRAPEEHRCRKDVPGDPGNGRRRPPHRDQSARSRPDLHHDRHRDVREQRRRRHLGAMDRSAARDRRLSRSPGAPSSTTGAHVHRLGRKGPRLLAQEPLRRLPRLQKHRRRSDLADPARRDYPTVSDRRSRRCASRTGANRSPSSPRRPPARCGVATTAVTTGVRSSPAWRPSPRAITTLRSSRSD